MSTAASRTDTLASEIFDMESEVCSVVHWGEAFVALGTAGINPSTAAVSVMGCALHDVALTLKSRWERSFALSHPQIGQQSSVPVSPALVRLVCEYEAAHRALDVESARLEKVGWTASEILHSILCGSCGQLRGQIALWPARTWPDLLLKVRAYGYGTDADEEDRDVRDTIHVQKGHGYLSDVAQGIANDLLRLRDVPLCA